MTEEEINKTIAEFMGYTVEGGLISHGTMYDKETDENCLYGTALYTQSLDALVPVVEKLEAFILINYLIGDEAPSLWEVKIGKDSPFVYNELPAMALATACAQIIKEIK